MPEQLLTRHCMHAVLPLLTLATSHGAHLGVEATRVGEILCAYCTCLPFPELASL